MLIGYLSESIVTFKLLHIQCHITTVILFVSGLSKVTSILPL